MTSDQISVRPQSSVLDQHGRAMGDLRVSVTDRCNLRCQYCMPEEEYSWLPKQDILEFEEIDRLVDLFIGVGVDKVRITGGEPLMRHNLHELVEMIARKPAIRDLAMTTNGVLLSQHMDRLAAAGLRRVTVSLDTLKPDRFFALSRRQGHDRVLGSLRELQQAGFTSTKIDTVIMRGFNDDELADLIEFGKTVHAEVRFIEYMDVGGATRWSMAQVMSREHMLAALSSRYGTITPITPDPTDKAPAARYRLSDGTTFGIISSTTQPFCATCNRSRLTADGLWYQCLYAAKGIDLRAPLRAGASHDDLTELLRSSWQQRADRGAEARLAARERGRFIPIAQLKEDSHLEMHTRGG
ncbi:molybdenum cofactor biosynthesis protein MoeA [Pandoraea iniqua]|uniref:GTP 3',8-cyclase n=1 Tax=Pandoraea iniqua TaxID=2508288 RepID=A0A5E4YFW1_9BURK|nr:GTP 3',8-cyclase MoaA [Pandoraea iniqua]VVE47347.1 molybdenum cofactor biosynthesis protein MoeA [Pandoraea iniqua]